MQNIINLDLTQIYSDLRKQFYINVPFPVARPVLEDAIDSFFKFLNEPDEIKSHINFSISPKHRRGDVGYQHRDPSDHIYNDSKEFFHYHPAILKKYGSFLNENSVVNEFVQKAAPIWDVTYQVLRNILEKFEPDFPGVCSKVFDTEDPHIVIRFLKYDWQKSEKYLAKPHYDAGSFTLAIAESAKGLRIGSRPEDLKLVEHKDGNAIFMLGSNFQKVMDSQDLCAGWHDVIQLTESHIGKPFARWAIVVFIDAQGVEALPRTETHKWYNG